MKLGEEQLQSAFKRRVAGAGTVPRTAQQASQAEGPSQQPGPCWPAPLMRSRELCSVVTFAHPEHSDFPTSIREGQCGPILSREHRDGTGRWEQPGHGSSAISRHTCTLVSLLATWPLPPGDLDKGDGPQGGAPGVQHCPLSQSPGPGLHSRMGVLDHCSHWTQEERAPTLSHTPRKTL